MTQKLQAVRGMNDVLPPDGAHWRYVESALAQLLGRHGYQEIRLPLVEPTALYARTLGDATDIVAKEMYTFTDRSGDSLTLRPEGTAGVVRAGLEHGLFQQRGLRVWYLGPMFRHERPQRGRYRQFHQVGAEHFGHAEPQADIELLALTAGLWPTLDLDPPRLEINTLGDAAARGRYREALRGYLGRNQQVLDDDDRRRLEHNPLRVLDSKNPALAAVLGEAPVLRDFLAPECAAHFAAVCAGLDALGIVYTVNPRLVRGLDYYSRTVFEWVSDDLGAQGTVCAGGRYDALVAQLGGRDTPALGFAMGLERVLALRGIRHASPQERPCWHLLPAEGAPREAGPALAARLRRQLPQLAVVLDVAGGGFRKQLERANRAGAAGVFLVGENEYAQGAVTVKPLRAATAIQETVVEAELPATLRRLGMAAHEQISDHTVLPGS